MISRKMEEEGKLRNSQMGRMEIEKGLTNLCIWERTAPQRGSKTSGEDTSKQMSRA